jgi:hypothetical protein
MILVLVVHAAVFAQRAIRACGGASATSVACTVLAIVQVVGIVLPWGALAARNSEPPTPSRATNALFAVIVGALMEVPWEAQAAGRGAAPSR